MIIQSKPQLTLLLKALAPIVALNKALQKDVPDFPLLNNELQLAEEMILQIKSELAIINTT